MELTPMTKTALHHISVWESTAAKLPVKVEFTECNLDHGNVTLFKGCAVINGKVRTLTWKGDGRCYYRSKRIAELDIPFDKALQ